MRGIITRYRAKSTTTRTALGLMFTGVTAGSLALAALVVATLLLGIQVPHQPITGFNAFTPAEHVIVASMITMATSPTVTVAGMIILGIGQLRQKPGNRSAAGR